MQNRRKEDQGYIISLILTFAARWVQLFFAFLGSMIPEQFQDLIPSALVMFFIWSVPICQAAACFVAIRYEKPQCPSNDHFLSSLFSPNCVTTMPPKMIAVPIHCMTLMCSSKIKNAHR